MTNAKLVVLVTLMASLVTVSHCVPYWEEAEADEVAMTDDEGQFHKLQRALESPEDEIQELQTARREPPALQNDEEKTHFIYSSCSKIKSKDQGAPSGEYSIRTQSGLILKRVYCEMGLNGGGYTFIHPFDLGKLTNVEVQALFTDQTNFLMRLRKQDNTQPYAVLQQINDYRNVPLKLGLNDNSGYKRPVNVDLTGPFYLYAGFIPASLASNRNKQGLKVNGIDTTFSNCDSNPNSYIALFPNFSESAPSTYAAAWTSSPSTDQLFARHYRNPSGRAIPVDYFMFMESHWGGCGGYTQTDGRVSARGVLGAAIGFR